ncbi:hypothetical protein [Candidatus Hamiltonella defensa]|nr:hypothetical protein [Candidatus Hamiltonella defensa]
MSVVNRSCVFIMVGRSGGAEKLAGFFRTSLRTLLRLATRFEAAW